MRAWGLAGHREGSALTECLWELLRGLNQGKHVPGVGPPWLRYRYEGGGGKKQGGHQEEIKTVPWSLGLVVVAEKGRRGQSGHLAKTEALGLLMDWLWKREKSHEDSKLWSLKAELSFEGLWRLERVGEFGVGVPAGPSRGSSCQTGRSQAWRVV